MAEATARKIDEIRQKYPAYKDVPDDKLAAALHKKFYAARSQAEVFERLGVPYPEQLAAPEPPAMEARPAMPDRLVAPETPRPAAAPPERLRAPEPPAPAPSVDGPGRVGTAVSQVGRGIVDALAGIPEGAAISQAQAAQQALARLDEIDAEGVSPRPQRPTSPFEAAPLLQPVIDEYRRTVDPARRADIRRQLTEAVDPRSNPLYQAGQSLTEAAEEALPVNDQYAQEFLAGQVPQAFGSGLGFIASSTLGRLARLPSFAAASGAGAALGASGGFEEAMAYGATIDDAFRAANLNAAVGLSEGIPIGNLLDRIDAGTGGSVRRLLVNVAKQGTEEAIQEAFQGIMSNAVAAGIYDPNRGIWDGVAEGAAAGGIVGGLLGLLTGLGGRHAPRAIPGQAEIDQRLDAAGARATDIANAAEAQRDQLAPTVTETPPAVVPPPVPAPTGDAGLSSQPAAATPEIEEEGDLELQEALQAINDTLRGPPEPAPTEELDAVLEAVDAGATPAEAVDAAAARREQLRVEAEQQAQAAAAGEAQAAADAEAAQQVEAAAQVAAESQARVEAEAASDSTGLASMGSGMAQAMGENLRERLWQEYAGQAQAIDPLAIRARREAPGMSREEFIAWAEAVDAGREPPVRAQPPGTTPQPKAQDEAPAAPAQAEPAPERPTGDAFDAMTAEDWRRRIPELEADVARAEAALASEKESGGSGVNVNLAKRAVANAKRYVARAQKQLAALEAKAPATPPAPSKDEHKPEATPAPAPKPEAAPAAPAGGERPIESMVAVAEDGAPTSPRVIVNRVGRDGMTDAERGGSLPPASSAPLTVESFSDKAIIIKGDTKTHKDRIKAVGGARWNRKAGGWIFPKKREAAVREALADLLGGEGEAAPAVEAAAASKEEPAWWSDLTQAGRSSIIRAAKRAGTFRKGERTTWNNMNEAERTALATAATQIRESEAAPAKPTVPVEDDRKRERLRKAREAGQAAARSGARRSPPDMFRGDLHGEWLAGYADYAASEAAKPDSDAVTKAKRDELRPLIQGIRESLPEEFVIRDTGAQLDLYRDGKQTEFVGFNRTVAGAEELLRIARRELAKEGEAATSKAKPTPQVAPIEGMTPLGAKPATYGSANKVFTEDAAAKARAILKAKLSGTQLNSGLDPEIVQAGITLAGYHIEAGARTFAAFTKAMVEDLGEAARPHLRSWYEGVRYYPGFDAKGMTPAAEIDGIIAGDQETETESVSVPEPDAAPADDRPGDEGSGATVPPATADAGQAASGDRAEDGAVRRDPVGPSEPGVDEDSQGGELQSPAGRRGSGGRSGAAKRGAGAGGGPRVSDYRAEPGSLKREGSWQATAERNIDIVELVNRLEAEGRPATSDEQAQIAKFTGWGASEIRQNLFATATRDSDGVMRLHPERHYRDNGWKPLVERAAKLLEGEDLDAAMRSSQYAHYTSEPVVRAIWNGVERMGFKGGRILEPGMGSGLFAVAGPAPVLDASRYTGIEFDKMTAAVAKALLPKQNILHADYVEQKLPDGFFDLGIGNPPFARISITQDPAYRRYRFSLHDYFFAKTIDKVRPGGLLVFVTSRYTMDKADDKARAYLADRADLLGAIRMPQTAFKQNAGTEVVTDVLFLRKRIPGEAPGGHPWRSLKEVDAGGEPVLINEFFVDNPANVLGSHSTAGSMYRENEYTVLPPEGSVEDAFAKVVGTLPENVMTEAAEREEAQQQARTIERDFNVSDRKEGSLYVSDAGDVMVVESGSGVPVDELRAVAPKQREWLRDYVGLRDAVKVAHKDQLTDGEWQKSLKALNKAYDAFVKKHGRIMAFSEFERESVSEDGEPVVTVYRRYKNEVLLRLDVEHPLIFALEAIGEDGTISKGRFLLDRTLDKPKPPKIETAQDAMMVTLDQVGRLDLGHIAGLLDSNVDQVIEDLGSSIYRTPEGEWQTADEYLSGDVRAKLEQARVAADADPAYERNVKALIDVQPRPLAPQEITVSLGSGWVPAEVVNTFTNDVLDLDTVATYEPALGKWTIPESSARSNRGMASEWGTKKISPYEILSAVLNNREIKVRSTVYENGKPKQIPDPAGTQEAQQIATKMRDRFRSWVWTDGGRAKRLAEIYNTRFNNIAPRRFDGSHLTTPGLSLKYNLHPHQKRAIWRIIQTGNTYLGHAVGAGKTLEMIVSAMEQRRLGMVRKPLFVVPNHMLNQFASEFIDAYPAAQIMVADEKGFHTDNRRRFIAQATLNDLDAIIITHSSFGKLDTKLESRQQIVQDMIAEIEAAIAANSGQDNRVLRRKLEAQKETIERRFLGKTDASEKDQALAFEEMGIDFLYLDEAHEFRKLDIITEMNAKGITPEGSKRALDLYIKTRWLQAQRPGRSMVFASGTPVTNTMGELHTVMRFMDEAALEADGLKAFDTWATQFGEVASSFEQNAAGQYESVARFAKFNNVPELMSRVRSFMDVLTSNQLRGLVKLPDLETGSPQNVVVPASDALKAYMRDELAPRIKAARDWKPTPHEKANPDPLINIITDARLSAIDMRFADPNAPDDPSSKLNRMVDGIIKFHKESARATFAGEGGKPDPVKGAAQIVFSSVGFGEMVAKNRGFDVRGHIMRRLKKAGVKPSEVAWMSDFKSHAKKQTLFKEMREGKVRILFGSPKNMGTGLNVQKRLRALHYLSPPWYPSDVEQPHGRILRQGNQNENVDIFWYATKGTYDSTAWGMVARKARFIEQAFTGDATVRTIEDISETSQYEMASAMAAGDERMIQLAGLSSDVERLALLREAHFSRQQSLQHDERRLDRDIKSTESSIATAKAGLKAIEKASGPRRFEIGDVKTEKPTEATAAIAAFMAKEMKRWVPKTAEDRLDVEIGTYAGLAINGRLYAMKDGKSLVPFADAGIEAGPAYERILHLSGAETLDGLTEGTHYGVAKSASDWVNGGLRRQLYARETELEEYRKELATTKKQIGAPFEFEGELAEKVAERERLQAEMLAEGAELPANTAMPERDAIEAWEGEGGALGAAAPRYSLRQPVADTPAEIAGASGTFRRGGAAIEWFRGDGELTIESLYSEDRGRGEARAVMQEFLALADQSSERVGLVAEPREDGVDDARLRAFYRGLGFRIRPGFSGEGLMTRAPQGPVERISYRLTDRAKTKFPALERDLRARLERLGLTDKVRLRLVEAIRTQVNGRTVEANAMWLRGAITVALDGADALGSLNHEVIHALRELGMFTRSEWRALERAAKADTDLLARVRRSYDGLGLTDAQMLEEVVAEHYRMWADGRAQNGGLMRRAFEKLRGFFKALGQALRGQGLTTAEGVFERVESGRVGRRGDRDVAQPSDLWAAIGTGATIAGVAAKAGMFNGMFSQRAGATATESEMPRFALRHPTPASTALARARGTAGQHVGKPTPLKERIAQWWEKTTENAMDRSVQATIDRFHSLRKLEERMLGGSKSRFSADHHMGAFTSAHFAMNESAYMHAAMYYGPPRLNRAEGVVEFDDGTRSLLTLLEPLDTQEKIDAFELYAWARRANELKRSGREPAPQSDIDDGLALAREFPDVVQVFNDWTAFNRKVVAFARDSGLITDEAARSYLADAHYVPFYRAEVDSQGRRLADRSMSSGSGITNMRSGIKRLKGSDKAVAGIIDNMVRNTERLIARSYRNIAAQKATALMIGASQQFGEEIIKKPPPKWALELVPMKMLEEAVSGAGLNVDFSNLSAAEKREIVGIWGMVPPAFRAPDGSMMFSVMIAGKPQWFVTTDPMLFESLSSLTPRQMGMIANTLFQIARAPARMLRWGVTNEPTFAIANFLRDTASTFVVYGAGPDHLARVMARFFKRSASGIVYGERSHDRSVAEIQAAGGGIGGWWSDGPSSVRKALQAQRRDVSLARKAGRAAMGFWERYQEVLRASEQANRIVLYDRLRAKGTSKAEAAFQAMDVTNFSARGSSEAVRILVELTPFLNARIQGLNRLYRGAAHKLSGNAGPYRSTRTGFVVNGLILMAATMALYAVNYDDEDYADLEGWERDLYYHIRLPKFLEEATGARWFRIPRPFEVGVIFSTLPERAMDQVFRLAGSEAKRDEDLTALRESLFRAATDTFAVQPTQIGKIAMEQWSNWSTFLGRSIVPTYEQEGLPPYMQYGPGTSEAAKWIGRQTGASPRRIEHLIRELGGSMAAHALVAADSAISQAQGRTDPARRWYEMPVISRFVRGDSVYTRWAERYYTLQQETDALVATINKLEREGADPAEIDALDTDEHRDRRQFFRGTRKDLRGIRDDMSDIYADPGMTPEAKRQALDELRRERTSIYREVRDLTVP